MKKRHKVVMLPTEKASNLWLQPNNLLRLANSLKEVGIAKPQHLYVLSDDEIKEKDWWFDGVNVRNDFTKWTKYQKGFDKKIIATTDKLITNCQCNSNPHKLTCDFNYREYLPQLPELFIEAYIKAYNEGKPITEVNLEYKYTINNKPLTHGNSHITPSITIKTRLDNTVIVHQSKMYSRDEVETLIKQFANECEHNKELMCYNGRLGNGNKDWRNTDLENWLKENL